MKRKANLIFLLIFVAALFFIPLATVLGPKSSVSFWENRSLAVFPQAKTESVLDGSFFSSLETCFSDHIAGRDTFLTLYTWAGLQLGRPVVNNLVVSSDVMLFFHGYSKWDTTYQQTQTARVAERLGAINELVTGYGGYFCYLNIPQQYSYFADHYPDFMDDRQWTLEPARQAFSAALSEQNVPLVDMVDIYAELGHPDSFYSAVDHHYSYFGALAAYEAVMARINADTNLDLNILHAGDGLELVTLPNHYLGSYTRKMYDLWPSDEKAVIGLPTVNIPFSRFDNGVQVEPTLYALPQSEEELLLYSLYMGGDVAETILCTNRPELPDALIFGESFTNAVETVLWTAFDETRSLDLRYYTTVSLEEYIAVYQPDVVICLRDDSCYLTSLD